MCAATTAACSTGSMACSCRKGCRCSARSCRRGSPIRSRCSPARCRRNTACAPQASSTSASSRERPTPAPRPRSWAAPTTGCSRRRSMAAAAATSTTSPSASTSATASVSRIRRRHGRRSMTTPPSGTGSPRSPASSTRTRGSPSSAAAPARATRSQQHQPGAQLHGARQFHLGQLDPRPAPVGKHLLRHRLAAEDLPGLQHAALGLCPLLAAQLSARRDRRPLVQRRRAVGAAHQLRHRRAGRRELEGGRPNTRCAAASSSSASVSRASRRPIPCRWFPIPTIRMRAAMPATSPSASPTAPISPAGPTASTCRTNGRCCRP